MSHPFPSLFSKKKKNVGTENELYYDEYIDDRDNIPKQYSSSTQAANANRMPPGPVDFATGNCMTCACFVRWPKELQVFRCTRCLTINDLKPYTPTPRSTIRVVPPGASHVQTTATSPPGVAADIRPSPRSLAFFLDTANHICSKPYFHPTY
jgi:E3 ubiquitin-protein ligase HECTD2